MNNNRVFLIGAGAQAKYVAEYFPFENNVITGIMDIKKHTTAAWPNHYDIPVFPFDKTLKITKELHTQNCLVCVADPQFKEELWHAVDSEGLSHYSFIHKSAVIAKSASIGEGCIINPGVVIQPFAVIGKGAMIHANSVIEHDVVLEDFVNIAPGTNICGWVLVGKGSTLSTGCNIIPKVQIGKDSVVGAGSTVINDIPNKVIAAGSPCRTLRDRS